MRDGFEAVVRAQLAVDVLEVVAQRLRGDVQAPGDAGGVSAVGQQLQDPTLLLREWLDRRVIRPVVGERDDLTGRCNHPLEEMFPGSTVVDVAREPDEEPPSRSRIVEHYRRHVYPDPVAGPRAHVEIEVGDSTPRSVPLTRRCLESPRQGFGPQRVTRIEYLVDAPMHDHVRRIAEQALGSCIPGADVAAGRDGVRGIGCLLEQREQFGFEHRPLACSTSKAAAARWRCVTRVSGSGTNASLSRTVRRCDHSSVPDAAAWRGSQDMYRPATDEQ